MIYVMSDIHGRKDLFDKMLDKINLNSDDTLFILGDMIDRGGDLSVLSEVIKLQKKGICIPIRGNHEDNLLRLLELYTPKEEFRKYVIYEKTSSNQSKKFKRNDYSLYNILKFPSELFLGLFNIYSKTRLITMMVDLQRCFNLFSVQNGGITLEHLNKMNLKDLNMLKKYIASMPLGVECTIDGKKFMLVHGGYNETKEKFSHEYKLDMRQEFFLNKVECSEPLTVVFGHTTTRDIKIIKDHELSVPYKIWHDDVNKDKIGIDCGACYPHGQLACLCLDTMEEYYVKNDFDTIVPVSYINKRFNIYKEYQKTVNNTYITDPEQKITFF